MKTINVATRPDTPVFGAVKAGDMVLIETRDGRHDRFVVQQVDGDTILAPGGMRYPAGDITRLQRRSFSGGKTSLLVGGIFAGLFVMFAAAAASALGSWE